MLTWTADAIDPDCDLEELNRFGERTVLAWCHELLDVPKTSVQQS